MKQIKSFAAILSIGFILLLTGCDKTKEYDVTVPPPQAHFMNNTILSYQILNANSSFKVPIGVTKVADVDRKVTISVTSSSGAVLGTDYTITNPEVTIKAGKVIDSFELKGVFARYQSGEKDTLILAITQPDVTPSDYNDTLRLVLRGPCFEGDVNLALMSGAYKSIEVFNNGTPYGPYSTPVVGTGTAGATTGTIVVSNIWNGGWGPITFNVDWTNVATRTVTVVPQVGIPGSDAGDLNAAYAGYQIAVRAFAGNPGTFSACDDSYTLRMQLGVSNGGVLLGYFAPLYEVKVTR